MKRLERIRHEWGLDQPMLVQYGVYLSKLARLDLGVSFITGRTVVTEITERFLKYSQTGAGCHHICDSDGSHFWIHFCCKAGKISGLFF